MPERSIKKVAVIGAGTMGAGIAQTCASSGFETLLFDLNKDLAHKAIEGIKKSLTAAVAKGRLTESGKEETLSKIQMVSRMEDIKADLIIEAIIEKLEPKQTVMKKLEAGNPTAILASNTSTFPITQIAQGLQNPDNCIGLHFFNPPHVMKLVEIISGASTNPEWVEVVKKFCHTLGKVAVVAKDSPGFIVNRVARPFYVESLKLVEDGAASIEAIDQLLRASGFKMGPFELMDLIGVDTNLAVTTSLYEAFHREPRFKPSWIQQQKVEQGNWGRKTGKGFYEYPSR